MAHIVMAYIVMAYTAMAHIDMAYTVMACTVLHTCQCSCLCACLDEQRFLLRETLAHAHARTHIHAHTYTHTHTCTHIHARARMHTHARARTRSYVHPCTHFRTLMYTDMSRRCDHHRLCRCRAARTRTSDGCSRDKRVKIAQKKCTLFGRRAELVERPGLHGRVCNCDNRLIWLLS